MPGFVTAPDRRARDCARRIGRRRDRSLHGFAAPAAPGKFAVGKPEAGDRATETVAARLGQIEARIEERAFHVRADGLAPGVQRSRRQMHEARVAVALHPHDAGNRAIVEDAPGAARALETGEREQLAGDETARSLGT